MSQQKPELKFCASSAAMAQLLSKLTCAEGETEGLVFGTILQRKTRHPTDTDYNAVRHDCLVTVKQVMVIEDRKMLFNDECKVDLAKLKSVVKSSSHSPLGWFSCRRNKPTQLSFREKIIMKGFCGGEPMLSGFGTLFLRITLDVTQEYSRHTTQYQAYYGPANRGTFTSVPFEVINLGDTSHNDYKSSSSLGLEQIPPGHLEMLNPRQTVQQALDFRRKIEDLLNDTCSKLKKVNNKFSQHHNQTDTEWITDILKKLDAQEEVQIVDVSPPPELSYQEENTSVPDIATPVDGLSFELQVKEEQESLLKDPIDELVDVVSEPTLSREAEVLQSEVEEAVGQEAKDSASASSQESCDSTANNLPPNVTSRGGKSRKKPKEEVEETPDAVVPKRKIFIVPKKEGSQSPKLTRGTLKNFKTSPHGSDA